MDSVNTRINQSNARELASTLSERTFVSSNLIGYSMGVSDFTKSENATLTQQVNHADKSSLEASKQEQESDKKLKAKSHTADKSLYQSEASFTESLDNISEMLKTNGTNLSFSINEEIDKAIVIVTDKESGDVIRQIPSEEMQEFAARVQALESSQHPLTGLVVDKRV